MGQAVWVCAGVYLRLGRPPRLILVPATITLLATMMLPATIHNGQIPSITTLVGRYALMGFEVAMLVRRVTGHGNITHYGSV